MRQPFIANPALNDSFRNAERLGNLDQIQIHTCISDEATEASNNLTSQTFNCRLPSIRATQALQGQAASKAGTPARGRAVAASPPLRSAIAAGRLAQRYFRAQFPACDSSCSLPMEKN